MDILEKQHILIVGASGGIGTESAKLLANSGAILFLTARDKSDLQALAKETDTPNERLFSMDVTDPEQVRQVAEKIHGQIDALDVLINASGRGLLASYDKIEPSEFADLIQVNLIGAFNVLKYFLDPMKAKKEGLVIHLPGVLGKAPMAGASAYAASKYGLNGLIKSLREDVRRTNIRFTNLYLGGTDTPFWDPIDMPVNRKKFVTAKDAGRAVWFLCRQPGSGVVSEMVLQPFNHQVL